MAKLHAIRRRIKSVTNIRQITKAMELVAASKLRRAQEATLRSRLYAHSTYEALQTLQAAGLSLAHPLFAQRPVTHHTLIVFSSDRGLAGAYNTNLLKATLDLVTSAPLQTFAAIVVGRKGAHWLARLHGRLTVTAVYTPWPSQPSAADIRPIATMAVERFLTTQTDQVTMLYTDFVSLAKQHVAQKKLLPLALDATSAASHDDRLFEPSPQAVLNTITPRIIEMQLYQASLEAAASEQSMRMVAMKNATENADDLKADLTLTYNGARQAGITQELAEIISGAEVIA